MARDLQVAAPDGRTLAVRLSGADDGWPLVVLHGTPGSRHGLHPDDAWWHEHGVRRIDYDRPGYGGSTRQPGRTVASAAADVAAIADALGLDWLAVLGRGGGAPHALACAGLLGDRVTAVALLGVIGPPDAGDLDFTTGMTPSNLAEFAAAASGQEALERVLAPQAAAIAQDPESLVATLERELPEPDQRFLAEPGLRVALAQQLVEAVRQGAAGWVDDDLALVQPWAFEPSMITSPVSVWHGELDALAPASHGQWVAEHVPGGEYRSVPQAGAIALVEHMPDVVRWLALHQ